MFSVRALLRILCLCVFSLSFSALTACAEETYKQPEVAQDRDIIDKDSSLMVMAASGDLEGVVALISEGAEVNARLENGATPLIVAAQMNTNPEVITVLLTAGAEVNARDEDGWTPLMVAAGKNTNPEMITTLLSNGSDAKLKDVTGRTALDLAKENEALKGTQAYWKLHDASF